MVSSAVVSEAGLKKRNMVPTTQSTKIIDIVVSADRFPAHDDVESNVDDPFDDDDDEGDMIESAHRSFPRRGSRLCGYLSVETLLLSDIVSDESQLKTMDLELWEGTWQYSGKSKICT